MQLSVLDKFEEEDAVCLLCRTSLRNYVEALPGDFKEYYIQRGIVSNRFLDNLWDTIAKKRHIPAIVLVAEQSIPSVGVGEVLELNSKFKVLDGLQRSSRIKEAWDAVNFIRTIHDDGQSPAVRVARRFSEDLKEIEISSALFQRILTTHREGIDIFSLFEDNHVWLEIWFNLSDSKQIQKMLVLNAGHKSVNIKHQVELLFVGYLELLEKSLGKASIIREKEQSSISYSKNRKPGLFHFSHLISAFVSLNSGKPITTNADFSAARSFEDFEDSDSLLGTDEKLLLEFADTLTDLDAKLTDDLGIKWLGREVVLVGIFGAIGAFAQKHNQTLHDALHLFRAKSELFVASLNLLEFEHVRNGLDLSKVNLGSVNKSAVFDATSQFLEQPTRAQIEWRRHFGQAR